MAMEMQEADEESGGPGYSKLCKQLLSKDNWLNKLQLPEQPLWPPPDDVEMI